MIARVLVLALALLPAVAGAQLVRVPPVRTVATLGACTDGSPKIVAITDGATASDCATGAGSYDVTCYCANGAWAAAASAAGTVTTFSVVTANGVSASVANATTAPAATFTLGAITPTSVAAVGSVTGANLSGTNTGDQTNISGNAATATALQATLGVSGGGTGATSLTAYAPVCGGTTTTGAVQSCSSGIGNVGYVLTTTGATSLPTWQAASGGGGTPGGSDTQCQFNDGGAFNGAIGCTYNKTTGALTLGDSLRVADNGLLSRYNGTLDVNSSWETFSGAYGIVPSTGWAFSSGGFNLKLNSDITAYTTSIMPRNTEHSFVLGNRVGGYDDVPGTVGVIGTHAYPSAATNLDGGAVVVSGGAAASASSGDADGGNVLLDGGLHYGTGDDGQIVIGNTRGSLRLKPRATIPIACAAGTEGTVYLDSDTHKPCYCNGTNYVLFSDDTTTCS